MNKNFQYTEQQVNTGGGVITLFLDITNAYPNQIQVYASVRPSPISWDPAKTPVENGMFPVNDNAEIIVPNGNYVAFSSDLKLYTSYAIPGVVVVDVLNKSNGNAPVDQFDVEMLVDPDIVTPGAVTTWQNYFSQNGKVRTDAKYVGGTSLPIGLQVNLNVQPSSFNSKFSVSISNTENWDPSSVIDISSINTSTVLTIQPNKYVIFELEELSGGSFAMDFDTYNVSSNSEWPGTIYNAPIVMYTNDNPDARAFWDQIVDDNNTNYTYSTKQIDTSTIPVELFVSYSMDGQNQLYILNSGGSPPSLDAFLPPSLNGLSQIDDGQIFLVNPGDYVTFGIECANPALYATDIPVTVINKTYNQAFVSDFLMTSIGP